LSQAAPAPSSFPQVAIPFTRIRVLLFICGTSANILSI
jgi:hypothetical protein